MSRPARSSIVGDAIVTFGVTWLTDLRKLEALDLDRLRVAHLAGDLIGTRLERARRQRFGSRFGCPTVTPSIFSRKW